MKAFQLKITIKNSKPPIWRRVIVPTGITFSQLALVLNKAMGWSGCHLFEFEFYHRELRVAEDIEDLHLGYNPYDYLEASTTYIREFLEEEDWFTYTYDLGDGWAHRVEIEQMLEDYPLNYPTVIKYKGNCPVEDCGGIDGYYNCLGILADESHSEHDEMLEWMQSQGYPEEYDKVLVNEELERECFYIWDGGETRGKAELYDDVFSGKHGLHATRRDRNKNLVVKESRKHQFEKAMDNFSKAMRSTDYWRENFGMATLKSILEDFDQEPLFEIAEEKGITGNLHCGKKRLVEKIAAKMLQPHVLRTYFLYLQDEEIQEFENAAKHRGLYTCKNFPLVSHVYNAAYIGVLEDGRVSVPQDVWQVYQAIANAQFHEKRRTYSYVLACMRTAGILYGIAPIDILLQMINQHPKICLTVTELEQIVNEIPPEYNTYLLKNKTFYHMEFYPDDRGLLGAQGNKEYYIPTVKEICEMGMYEYFASDVSLIKFKKFLQKELAASNDEAEIAAKIIQRKICSDCELQEIFDVLGDMALIDGENSLDMIDKLAKQILHLWNCTRMILNRGFTPDEISRQKDQSKVIDFQEARKNKVYPNDPCPCGSGKKYKKCCGRSQK